MRRLYAQVPQMNINCFADIFSRFQEASLKSKKKKLEKFEEWVLTLLRRFHHFRGVLTKISPNKTTIRQRQKQEQQIKRRSVLWISDLFKTAFFLWFSLCFFKARRILFSNERWLTDTVCYCDSVIARRK